MNTGLLSPSRRIVLIENPRGGHAGQGQARAHTAPAAERLTVAETVPVQRLDRRNLHVHADRPLALSLDGEVSAQIPGDFAVAADALRVITPQHFVDVDD